MTPLEVLFRVLFIGIFSLCGLLLGNGVSALFQTRAKSRQVLELEGARARMLSRVKETEAALEAMNARYGAPKGWRAPGIKSYEERVADIDAEIARIREEYWLS